MQVEFLHVLLHTCRGFLSVPELCTYLSESFSANSSDKLGMPQLGGHVTAGGLSIEHVEEIFTSQVGSMDQFDWFEGYNVGFITRSLASHIERLALNTHGVPFSCACLVHRWWSNDGLTSSMHDGHHDGFW